jgi:hypothetical protein
VYDCKTRIIATLFFVVPLYGCSRGHPSQGDRDGVKIGVARPNVQVDVATGTHVLLLDEVDEFRWSIRQLGA